MNLYKVTTYIVSAFVLAKSTKAAIDCFINRFAEEYTCMNDLFIDRVARIAGDNLLPNSRTDHPNCLIVSQEDVCEWLEGEGYKVTRKDK